MRILMISDVYFPRINGVSSSILTFRQALQALGAKVDLIAPAYPGNTAHEEGIYRIPSRYLPLDPEDRMMQMSAIMRRAADFKKKRYQLIHIQTPFIAHYAGVQLSELLGIPRVESYHTFFEEYLYHYIPFLPKRFLRQLAKHYTRNQCNNVDAVIVPSRAMQRVLIDYGVNTPTTIIPTGIQPEAFSEGNGKKFRDQHRIPADRPVVAHIGRIAHEKNIAFLLHVLDETRKSIPNILLVIAGEGPARKHLQKLSHKLSLQRHVLFVGYLSRDRELPDCYKAGNAFIFASRTETQGLVLLEAMMLGVPVVSTAVMGTEDILKNCPGAIVCEESVGDFSSKLIALLNNPAQQAALSSAARQHARTWTDKVFAEKMLALYKNICSGCIDPHQNKELSFETWQNGHSPHH